MMPFGAACFSIQQSGTMHPTGIAEAAESSGYRQMEPFVFMLLFTPYSLSRRIYAG
jgi:hypothetical protein